MIARPLIAGHRYQVHGVGVDLTVIASNPCDALCIAIGYLEGILV